MPDFNIGDISEQSSQKHNCFAIGDKVIIIQNLYEGNTLADFGLEAGDKGEVVGIETDNTEYSVIVQFSCKEFKMYCSPLELKLDNGYKVDLI